VPAERSGTKPHRLFGKDQQGEFEGFGESDVLELRGGGSGSGELPLSIARRKRP